MVPELLIPLAALFSLVHYCISDFIPVRLAGTVRVPCPQLCWGTGKPFHAHGLAAPPAESPAGKALAWCFPGVFPVFARRSRCLPAHQQRGAAVGAGGSGDGMEPE